MHTFLSHFYTITKQPISNVAHELKWTWKIVVEIKMSLGLVENQRKH